MFKGNRSLDWSYLLGCIIVLCILALTRGAQANAVPDNPEIQAWACGTAVPAPSSEERSAARQKLLVEKGGLETKLYELSNVQDINPQLGEVQERLIQITALLECYEDRDREGLPIRGPGVLATGQRNVEVETFFGTNRATTGVQDPYRIFGKARGDLILGSQVVSIPTDREKGTLRNFHYWSNSSSADVSLYFVLRPSERLSEQDLRIRLGAMLTGSGQGAGQWALVFVHGFNVTYAEAALRTAQIAHDIGFAGAPLFFSWPSQGEISLAAYKADARMVEESEGAFASFMEIVLGQNYTKVILIAHSMGNRLVSEYLEKAAKAGKRIPKIDTVILAAPDISAEVFNNRLAPILEKITDTRMTLYASANDLTMKVSRIANPGQGRRLGDMIEGGVFLHKWMDAIDVTKLAPWIRHFGHSYVADNKSVLRDVRLMLLQRKPSAEQRKLRRLDSSGYWYIPDSVAW